MRFPARSRGLAVAWLAGGLVLLVGCLAAGSLLLFYRAYQQSVHETAALTVLDRGAAITRRLAEHPFVTRGEAQDAFSALVGQAAALEEGVQYVSVVVEGEIVFHEQVRAPGAEPGPARPAVREPQVNRRMLDLGGTNVAVLTFTLPSHAGDGGRRSLQVALRREAVEREEAQARVALAGLFRLGLWTVGAAFGCCGALIVWLVRAEVRREAQQRGAERLAFAGAMANGILHDLRNPLSALGLDAQLLEKEVQRPAGPRPERLCELAQRTRRTVERLDGVLRDSLALAGPTRAESAPFDLQRDVLRDCLDLLAPRFARAGVKLEERMSADPVPLHGRAIELRRAFLNLLVNALQASEAGGVVTLEVRPHPDNGRVVARVIDQGRGVPRGERGRVFDLFYSSRPGGTGLGLALARAAVESHGGRVRVEDAPGGPGAVFAVELPLAPRGRDHG